MKKRTNTNIDSGVDTEDWKTRRVINSIDENDDLRTSKKTVEYRYGKHEHVMKRQRVV